MSDGQGLRGRGIGEDRRRDIHRKGGRGHQVKSKTKTTEKGGLGKREESGKEDVYQAPRLKERHCGSRAEPADVD